MALYWKAAAAVLITLILCLTVGKQEKDISALLTIAACSMIGVVAISYLEPVLDFLYELEVLGQLQGGLLGILIQAVGIALVAELIGTLCADAGNGSLGKMLHLLSSGAILYLSIPIIQALLTLIREILGEL